MSEPIASPCIKVCAVDGRSNSCVGCGRTLAEIGAWTRLSPSQREAIMAALPARLALLNAGGPAGSADSYGRDGA
jgi:predicted Fe-S protein YdhL (DUF1289 family)